MAFHTSFQGGNVGHLHKLLEIESSSQVNYKLFPKVVMRSFQTYGASMCKYSTLKYCYFFLGSLCRGSYLWGYFTQQESSRYKCLFSSCCIFLVFLSQLSDNLFIHSEYKLKIIHTFLFQFFFNLVAVISLFYVLLSRVEDNACCSRT